MALAMFIGFRIGRSCVEGYEGLKRDRSGCIMFLREGIKFWNFLLDNDSAIPVIPDV